MNLGYNDRVPLEHAIEVIEQVCEKDLVRRSVLQAEVLSDPRWTEEDHKMLWWLDHTLSLLVNRGMLKRHHIKPGELGYEPTDAWHGRDEVIGPLRPPKKKNRFARDRARREARERRRLERLRAKQTHQGREGGAGEVEDV